jgi:hypothetical protein
MNNTIISIWAGHTMGFDPQVEALLPYLLMKVFDAMGKRRGRPCFHLIITIIIRNLLQKPALCYKNEKAKHCDNLLL